METIAIAVIFGIFACVFEGVATRKKVVADEFFENAVSYERAEWERRAGDE